MERRAAVPRLHLGGGGGGTQAESSDDVSEEENETESMSEEEQERVDHLQVLAATISLLREEEGTQSDEENEDVGEQTVFTKRRRLVRPLEMVYAHFERQQDDLQQAAAFGKMLLEKNKQLEEQLDVYNNSPILNGYQDKIRLQQEKIWELQGREESLRTEFEELKVELKVKKRLLNSKSRLAEQLEAKLWDYIQKMEREKESRDNEESKKLKKELEHKEKVRKLSDDVENCKDELREAKSENERLRKQVSHLLEKIGSFRSELTRERERRSRSNSFSRRLSSFFITKSEGEIGDETDDIVFVDSEGEHGSGSSPASRRHSGRGKQLFESGLGEHPQLQTETAACDVSSKDPPAPNDELAEWRDKAQRLKEENESLRRELGGLSEDHMKLRESVNSMRDHERKLEKERKRERKLLAQSQQTIEELKLRILDAQLLDMPSTPAAATMLVSSNSRGSESHPIPVSFSLPATPQTNSLRSHSGEAGPSLPFQSPIPLPSTPQPSIGRTPLKPQRYQSLPHFQAHSGLLLDAQEISGQSMQDELAAIDDILADDETKNETRLLSTPRVSSSTSTASTATAISTPRRSPLQPSSPSTPAVDEKEKEKRVWLVAEGQRGRANESEKDQTLSETGFEDIDNKSKEVVAASTAKRPNDGRLFIFAEELEKKVVEKFVYDEEELKAGLQEEVEACVADFLAKREQELQSIEPAVLKARRKRAISGERDDLLLFFGVFLTSSDDAAAAAVSSSSDADGSGQRQDKGISSSDTSDRDDDDEEEDGWQILDEWRAGRKAADESGDKASSSQNVARLKSGSGGNSGVIGNEPGRTSLAAVQTWVKHIPFDLSNGRRRNSESDQEPSPTATTASASVADEADDLDLIEAAIDGRPHTARPVASELSPSKQSLPTPEPLDRVPDPKTEENERRTLVIRGKELDELENLLRVRRKEFEAAMRAIVTVVPGTVALPRRHLRLREPNLRWPPWPLNVLDIILYD